MPRRHFVVRHAVGSMGVPLIIVLGTTVFVVACWWTDLASRRIPNGLTGVAFGVGVLVNIWIYGIAGGLASIVGAVLAGGILALPFALGGVGGGDVKMMGAVGAWLGPYLALLGLAAGLVLGGLFSVLHLTRIGRLGDKLRATTTMVQGAVARRSLDPLRLSDEAADAVTLPYSLPLGLGTLGALFLRMS